MSIKRFEEIDVMRIMGFLMVVDQHILGAYAQRSETGFADSLILHFLYLIGRPAVPMFVAITGFTLFYSNQNSFNVKDFYKKRLGTIVIPYLFWSLASILVFNEYDKLKHLAAVLATGTASYHLWYMGMSIRLYILFPILLALTAWILKRKNITKGLMFILFCIFYLVIFKEKNYLANCLSMLFFGSTSLLEKRFIEYDPIFWSIYFVCGAIAFFRYQDFKKAALKYSRVIVVTYIPLIIYMYYTQVCSILPQYFPRIAYEHALYVLFMIQTTVIIYIISIKFTNGTSGLKKYVPLLGRLTFGAYLLHVIVLQRIAVIVQWIIPAGSYLVSGTIIFIASSIVSLGICYIIGFFPFSKYIIGVKLKQG